jgi:serine/threonine protein kinase
MDDHKELIGKRIGSYQVVRLVGIGGMGVVYEGHHTQLKRRTAIKILNEQFARNSQIAERFWNEARIVSVIQHPGLVSVLELGELPGGAPYIIMEYLDGESVGHRIQRTGGRLVADTLRLGRQIASTLAVVHARGVVHRDLKPDNIMIVADPEASGGERAKLLDFGIAKISVESGLSGQIEHRKTRTGAILGTPLYMAPENITLQLSDGDFGLVRGWGLFWD